MVRVRLRAPPVRRSCNGVCVDAEHRTRTTAAVAATSAQAESTCTGGTCTCDPGTTLCNGVCVDASTDPNNCGSCGNDCTTGSSCMDGTCGGICPRHDPCDGVCVNENTDRTTAAGVEMSAAPARHARAAPVRVPALRAPRCVVACVSTRIPTRTTVVPVGRFVRSATHAPAAPASQPKWLDPACRRPVWRVLPRATPQRPWPWHMSRSAVGRKPSPASSSCSWNRPWKRPPSSGRKSGKLLLQQWRDRTHGVHRQLE